MTPLERRYRRVLRLLPAGYRDDWEEDMVGSFLDAADAERDDGDLVDDELAGLRHPSTGEVVAVAVLAVRLRLAAPATPGASARAVVAGEAVRRVALLGLLVPAALVVVELVGSVVFELIETSSPFPPASSDLALRDLLPQGGWVLAYIALAGGWRRAALVLAPATWAAVVLVWTAGVVGRRDPAAGPVVEAVALAVPVLALVAWHADAAPPSRRWLVALPTVVGVVGALNLPAHLGLPVVWDRAGLLCLLVLSVAVVLRVRRRKDARDALAWSAALALAAPVAVLWRAAFVLEVLPYATEEPGLQLLTAVCALQAVAAAVVAATAWATLRHELRRQPKVEQTSPSAAP